VFTLVGAGCSSACVAASAPELLMVGRVLVGINSGLYYTGVRWSDVTESVVMIRSPFCGHNTIQRVELNGEDLSCYSNNTELVSLRKKQFWSVITDLPTKRIWALSSQWQTFLGVFTYKMVAKINWHRYGTKVRHCYPTGVKGVNVTSNGWQVTPRDPTWHVSSCSGEAQSCC